MSGVIRNAASAAARSIGSENVTTMSGVVVVPLPGGAVVPGPPATSVHGPPSSLYCTVYVAMSVVPATAPHVRVHASARSYAGSGVTVESGAGGSPRGHV